MLASGVLFSFRKIPGCNWEGLVSVWEEDQMRQSKIEKIAGKWQISLVPQIFLRARTVMFKWKRKGD